MSKLNLDIKTMNERLMNYTILVSSFYGIPHEFIFIKTRKREIVQVRQMVSCIARELLGIGSRRIGRFFGISYVNITIGMKSVENHLYTDKKYRDEYNELIRICKDYYGLDYFYNIDNDFCDITTLTKTDNI